jgi:hypothetical protein
VRLLRVGRDIAVGSARVLLSGLALLPEFGDECLGGWCSGTRAGRRTWNGALLQPAAAAIGLVDAGAPVQCVPVSPMSTAFNQM